MYLPPALVKTTFGNSSPPSANFTPAAGVGVRDFEELQTLRDVSFDGRGSELRIAGAAKVSAEGLNLRDVSFDGGGKFRGVDAAACVLQPLKAYRLGRWQPLDRGLHSLDYIKLLGPPTWASGLNTYRVNPSMPAKFLIILTLFNRHGSAPMGKG